MLCNHILFIANLFLSVIVIFFGVYTYFFGDFGLVSPSLIGGGDQTISIPNIIVLI